MQKKISVTIFLFIASFLFSQELDLSSPPLNSFSEDATVSDSNNIVSIDNDNSSVSFEDLDQEDELSDFLDEWQLGYAMLLIEPLTPRFGFRDKNRDPYCISSASQSDYLVGSVVPKASYMPKRDKNGTIIRDVNQEFFFDYEYLFGVSSQFIVLPWLSISLGFSFGYEQLPFITNLPDANQAQGITQEAILALPKYPTYYSIAVLNASGDVKGRLASFPYTDSNGNSFYSASVAYGVFRVELSPGILFFPLKNIGKDLKGFYLGVTPTLGLSIDSPTKIYLDLLYSSDRLRSITLTNANASPKAALQSAIHQQDNWDYIRQEIDKEGAINNYISFYGGARFDIGWQGTFKNGLVLNSSFGVGADSSRKFYFQMKGAIGYLFR